MKPFKMTKDKFIDQNLRRWNKMVKELEDGNYGDLCMLMYYMQEYVEKTGGPKIDQMTMLAVTMNCIESVLNE